MAAGDLTVFEEFALALGDEVHDFAADTFKLGLVTSSSTPTASDATPTWSDYVANEVGTGGGYPANGITLGSVTFSEAGGVATFDAANITITQDGSGFTDARWGILYNDDAASDQAIAFLDLGGDVSEQAGDITITWNASGIFTITVS